MDEDAARAAVMAKIEPFWAERPVERHLSIGYGWLPIVSRLIDDLAALGPLKVVQVKEKFGGLRFYTEGYDDTQEARIREAELESERTCETCGEPGTTVTIGGWRQTLCEEDARKQEAARKARWEKT